MRSAAIIVLLFLLPGVMVPPVLVVPSTQDGMPCIGTLDICHSTAAALASGGEMPCENESFFSPCPLLSVTTAAWSDPSFAPAAFRFPIDQPPRA